jgi:hypothetical protein
MSIGAYIKEHPVEIGGVALVGAFVLYLILRGSGSSSQSSSGIGAVAAADEQEQQLQAASDVQDNQTAAAAQAANLQATVQNNQTVAAANAQNEQTDASLVAALAQNQTNAQQYELSAEVTNNTNSLEANVMNSQNQDELSALENNNSTQLSGLNDELGNQLSLAQIQQQLTGQGLTESYNLAQNAAEDTSEEVNTLLPQLGTHTGDYSQTIASLIEGIEAPGSGGSEAALGAVNENVGAVNFSTLVNGISNLGRTVTNAL